MGKLFRQLPVWARIGLGLVVILIAVVQLVLAVFDSPRTIQVATAPVYGYRIVNSYPHDPDAFKAYKKAPDYYD